MEGQWEMGGGRWAVAKRGRPFARHCTLLVAAAKSDECVKCKLCYGEITVEGESESERGRAVSANCKEKPERKKKNPVACGKKSAKSQRRRAKVT